ncbi:hypothetical protein [Alkalibacillus haloalkaliphilus]|uniref:hypothetical protein n=1 Tax=Alkalibacillus haloalkaliphilus TaxID=94136 RepID=UPI001ED904E4|nr:hypothetical protein [Alkalibacillus haloalkaliphilus]
MYMITIRPITTEDYEYVLNWSKDEKFCLANAGGSTGTSKNYIDGGFIVLIMIQKTFSD